MSEISYEELTQKYMTGSQIKHAFWSSVSRYSVCGTGIIWYSPEEWQTDEVGLSKKRMCRRCTRILTGE